MTVSSTTRKAGPFTGNGIQTAFPFSFKVFTKYDVAVTRADTFGVESVLVVDSDYTVSLNANQDSSPGGTVTLASSLSLNYKLTITGAMTYSQSTDLPTGGAYNAQNVEDALDRTVILTQQLQESLDRAVKVPVTSSTDPDNLLTELATDVANAAASASAAATSETNAAASAASAQSSWNAFRGQYYGALAADPSTDPLGNPVGTGDMYWNTATSAMRVYTGSTWVNAGVANLIYEERFSGTGSQTVYTLANPAAFQNAVEVFLSGVAQTPGVDYTVGGAAMTTLTFTTAPPAGTNNIRVRTSGVAVSGPIVNGSISAPSLNGAQTGDAPIFAPRAWVVFNGNGSTGPQTILASGNVASVERWVTGIYDITFTTPMPSSTYAVTGSVFGSTLHLTSSSISSTGCTVAVAATTATGTPTNSSRVSVVILG